MHFAAALEICSNFETSVEVNWFFWGSRTSFPNPMNADNYLLTGKIPHNLSNAIHESHPNLKLSTEFNICSEWVKENLDRLLEKAKSITSMGELTQLDDELLAPSAAISNCLTNLLRQGTFDFNKHKTLLRYSLKSYLEVYSAASKAALESDSDLGIIFNGRFLHERACWDALENLGIPVQIYEVTRDRYFTRPEGFHNRVMNQKYIQQFWESSSGSQIEREKVAKEYFEQLRYGKNPFIRAQESSSIEKHKCFVYFANSDDEAFGFWESWKQPLGNQHEVIRRLQQIFDDRGEEKLIIRLHPNFANKSPEERQIWNSILETPYSRVIGFEEKVSSYSLMEQATGILTFGSTIGLEAAYWKKPVAVPDKISDWASFKKWIDSGYPSKDEIIDSRHVASFKKPWYMSRAGCNFINSQLREIGAPGWGSWEAVSFKNIKLRRNIFLTKFSRVLTRIRLSILRLK
jgi:hypothetical protein